MKKRFDLEKELNTYLIREENPTHTSKNIKRILEDYHNHKILEILNEGDFFKYERISGKVELDYIKKINKLSNGHLTYNDNCKFSIYENTMSYNKSISVYIFNSNNDTYTLFHKWVNPNLS